MSPARRSPPSSWPPAPAQAPAKASPKTDDEKTVYAVGVAIQKSLETFKLTPAELELVVAGLRDAAAGKAEVKLEEKQAAIQQLAMARRAAAGRRGQARPARPTSRRPPRRPARSRPPRAWSTSR